jgi:hypothetical protein
LPKLVRKGKGKDDFADIVDEPGEVIEVAPAFLVAQGEDLPAEDGSSDAVFPEFIPVGMLIVTLELLEVLDDGGGNEELVDFLKACGQCGFLNVCTGLGVLVDEGVGEAQETGSQRGIPANEFGNLREVCVVRLQ